MRKVPRGAYLVAAPGALRIPRRNLRATLRIRLGPTSTATTAAIAATASIAAAAVAALLALPVPLGNLCAALGRS